MGWEEEGAAETKQNVSFTFFHFALSLSLHGKMGLVGLSLSLHFLSLSLAWRFLTILRKHKYSVGI